MQITKKAQIASILLATILLAGCAPTSAGTEPVSAPKETVEQAPETQAPEDPFIDLATNGEVDVVRVLEVIDPRTFVVGPYLYDETDRDPEVVVTVAIAPNPELITPVEGECGYDEAISFADQFFGILYDRPSVQKGILISEEYPDRIVNAGFAYTTATSGVLYEAQENAELNRSGLWASCPGFGA